MSNFLIQTNIPIFHYSKSKEITEASKHSFNFPPEADTIPETFIYPYDLIGRFFPKLEIFPKYIKKPAKNS